MRISARGQNIRQSDIRTMTTACREAGGINLAQGVCDIKVPDEVIAAAKKAMDEGYNVYTPNHGLPELRQAIADKTAAFYGYRPDPETEIVASLGATGVFYCAAMALLNPGDEVILFEPYYGYHASTLEAVGAIPVFVPTKPGTWEIEPDALAKAVTPRTKGIVLCTPGNPSGHVMTAGEIDLIAEAAQKHDLVIFSDEIYEHFLYDGRTHLCPGLHPGLEGRTVTMSGASKTYAITGWRLGYCICPADVTEAVTHLNDLVYVCAPAPLQMGVAAGMNMLGRDYYEGLARDHQKKRDLFCDTIEKAGMKPYRPEGAYYVLADVSGVPGHDSFTRAMHILEKTGVSSVPGRAFFHDDSGDALVRFCFAKEFPVLEEACDRIASWKG
ncbi:aminotransferase class I and II [Desulfatibacillum aliphaticivorans]|uniref:Aminotransferase n=1 Tax=Desulfatibacillum aliphaticivorans TaxID=218208 RepID=B8FKD1_DESAL|nr:pyridoxal phosphate-dependent aminotransferase [Desulfatibacillum aliphaticivorans]ACL01746.1 aminotransferase class I and II [Desulfatibacillum aliphaticivorans]